MATGTLTILTDANPIVFPKDVDWSQSIQVDCIGQGGDGGPGGAMGTSAGGGGAAAYARYTATLNEAHAFSATFIAGNGVNSPTFKNETSATELCKAKNGTSSTGIIGGAGASSVGCIGDSISAGGNGGSKGPGGIIGGGGGEAGGPTQSGMGGTAGNLGGDGGTGNDGADGGAGGASGGGGAGQDGTGYGAGGGGGGEGSGVGGSGGAAVVIITYTILEPNATTVTPKPAHADAERNLAGPRADRAVNILPATDGSGTTLANIGNGGAMAPAVQGTPNWIAGDAEAEAYLHFRNPNGDEGNYLLVESYTAETIRRGSMLLRWASMATPDVGETQYVLACNVGSTGGLALIEKSTGLSLTHHGGEEYAWPLPARGARCTILVHWGERGFRATLVADGEYVSPTTEPADALDDVTPMIFNGSLEFGASTGANFHPSLALLGFVQWSFPLETLESQLSESDPALNTRPSAAVAALFDVFTYPSVTFDDDANTNYKVIAHVASGAASATLIAQHDTDPLFGNPTEVVSAAVTDDDTRLELELPNVPANSYVRFFASPDSGTTRHPFTSGHGRINFGQKIAMLSDTHLLFGGSQDYIGMFEDARFKIAMYRLSFALQDVFENTAIGAVLWGGDNMMFASPGAKTNDQQSAVWLNCTCRARQAGCVIDAIGNHENFHGNATNRANAIAAFGKYFCNPKDFGTEGYFTHRGLSMYVQEFYGDTNIANDGSGQQDGPPWVRTQEKKAAMQAWATAARSAGKARAMFRHHTPGGCKVTSLKWYPRSACWEIRDSARTTFDITTAEQALSAPEIAAAIGQPGHGNEAWDHRFAKQYGLSFVAQGHDHTFCRSNPDGVEYLVLPTPCDLLMFGALQPTIYGNNLLLGSDFADKGVQRTESMFGYVLVDVVGGRATIDLRKAFVSQDNASLDAKFIYDSIDYIGPERTAGADGVIALSERPRSVLFVGDKATADANPPTSATPFDAQQLYTGFTAPFSDLTENGAGCDYETPHGTEQIPSSATLGQAVRVNAAPETTASYTLNPAGSNLATMSAAPALLFGRRRR